MYIKNTKDISLEWVEALIPILGQQIGRVRKKRKDLNWSTW